MSTANASTDASRLTPRLSRQLRSVLASLAIALGCVGCTSTGGGAVPFARCITDGALRLQEQGAAALSVDCRVEPGARVLLFPRQPVTRRDLELAGVSAREVERINALTLEPGSSRINVLSAGGRRDSRTTAHRRQVRVRRLLTTTAPRGLVSIELRRHGGRVELVGIRASSKR